MRESSKSNRDESKLCSGRAFGDGFPEARGLLLRLLGLRHIVPLSAQMFAWVKFGQKWPQSEGEFSFPWFTIDSSQALIPSALGGFS